MSKNDTKPVTVPQKGTGKSTKGRVNINKLMGKEASSANGAIEYQKPIGEHEMEKDAAFWDAVLNNQTIRNAASNPALQKAFYTGAGAVGAMMLGAGVNKALSAGANAINSLSYDSNLRKAMEISPVLKQYDINILREYMKMIIKASPTVASDPRLLANYLESMLDAEGHLNLSTFGELANLENTILNNEQMRSPMGSAFGSGISKGIGEGVAKTLQYAGKRVF